MVPYIAYMGVSLVFMRLSLMREDLSLDLSKDSDEKAVSRAIVCLGILNFVLWCY